MKVVGSILAAFPLLLSFAANPASGGVLEDIVYPPDASGILPIERILDQARASVSGRILEVELEHEHGREIYEVVILTADNRKVEIEYDARTGAEISRELKKSRSKKED